MFKFLRSLNLNPHQEVHQLHGIMANFMLVGILFFAITKLSEADYCKANNKDTYSYHGSRNDATEWPHLFPTCNGNFQSPINIISSQVTWDSSLERLSCQGYNVPVKRAVVKNDGHTVKISPRDNIKRGIDFRGKRYYLQQILFHWGSNAYPGGEHAIDGYRYEMEVHLVHKSSDDKIAVVAVFMHGEERKNPAFIPVVQILNDVRFKGNYTRLQSSLYLDKVLPENPASYYWYTGSLTTPMCDEGVQWFLLRKKQIIGWKQLKYFSKIYSVGAEDKSVECLLAPNNRPIQKLNGRPIYGSP